MFVYPFPERSAVFTNIVHVAFSAGDEIHGSQSFTCDVFGKFTLSYILGV